MQSYEKNSQISEKDLAKFIVLHKYFCFTIGSYLPEGFWSLAWWFMKKYFGVCCGIYVS